MCFETTEQYIKNAIWQKIDEKALEEKKKKVSDRLKQKILKTICVSIPSCRFCPRVPNKTEEDRLENKTELH